MRERPALLDPVALLLTFALILEMLGAYTALAAFRHYFIFAGALCLSASFVFVPNTLECVRRSFRLLPTFPALLYLVWTIVLCVFSPYSTFARAETLRVFCGVMAYLLLVGYRPAARSLVPLLLLCGLLQSCYDFYLLGLRGGIKDGFDYSAFATHQELGSFLMLLLPLCIPYLFPSQKHAQTDIATATRLASLGAILFFFLAFLIARCRSAWFGGVMGSLVGLGLAGWYAWRGRKYAARKTQRKQLFSKVLIAITPLACLVIFFFVTGGNKALSSRAATVTRLSDEMGDRRIYWRAGFAMAKEHPLTGWGPGSFMVLQNRWTGIGRDSESVLRFGANHFNIAHSYYAQWMADTGFTGLLIHLSVLVSIGITIARCLRDNLARRTPLLELIPVFAGTAGIFAGTIDAISSPSYNYHVIFLLWWMVIGLTMSQVQAIQDRTRK